MVAIAVVSRHPPPHFVESAAALLLLLGISTPAAAAVVTGFELWLLAMQSGAWTSALLAAMASGGRADRPRRLVGGCAVVRMAPY